MGVARELQIVQAAAQKVEHYEIAAYVTTEVLEFSIHQSDEQLRFPMTEEPTSTLPLDDAQHDRRQHFEWLGERCGTVLICMTLIASSIGLLGPGHLSHRRVTHPDGTLSVDYYTIQHNETPVELKVYFDRPAGDSNAIRIGISRSLTDRMTIDQITPSPQSTATSEDRVIYDFRATGDKGSIIFRYKNNEVGSVHYEVSLQDGPAIQISQLILP